MKISIGMNLQPGAWGGGNQFGHVLNRYLSEQGHEVSFDLACPDLDIILLTEPDKKLRTSAYDHKDIARYLAWRNRRALVVHRINNSSEARNDKKREFNKFRIAANTQVADHTVFISNWVYERYVESGFDSAEYSIIMNGGDTRVWFNNKRPHVSEPLRIVTHHWSSNAKKGFDIYECLDALLTNSDWSKRIVFTYIGPLSDGYKFNAVQHIQALSGKELADELRRCDIYLTAALHEAAGMHHIEGALCGLPLLYRKSGALPEYCQGFGVEFTDGNFEKKLKEMINEYDHWQTRMARYPYTAEKMCQSYCELFESLLSRRDELLTKRRLWCRLKYLLKAFC